MSVGTDQAMRTRIGDQDRRRDFVTSSCELPQGVSDHIEVPPAEPRTITVLPPSTRVELHTGAARCDPGLLGFPGAFVVDGECPAAPTAPQAPGPAAPRSAVNADPWRALCKRDSKLRRVRGRSWRVARVAGACTPHVRGRPWTMRFGRRGSGRKGSWGNDDHAKTCTRGLAVGRRACGVCAGWRRGR